MALELLGLGCGTPVEAAAARKVKERDPQACGRACWAVTYVLALVLAAPGLVLAPSWAELIAPPAPALNVAALPLPAAPGAGPATATASKS